MRRLGFKLALLGVLVAPLAHAAPASPGFEQIISADAVSLRGGSRWLRHSGRDGFVGADVADVMGFPRQITEDVLEACQRGFKNEDGLRIATTLADDKCEI